MYHEINNSHSALLCGCFVVLFFLSGVRKLAQLRKGDFGGHFERRYAWVWSRVCVVGNTISRPSFSMNSNSTWQFNVHICPSIKLILMVEPEQVTCSSVQWQLAGPKATVFPLTNTDESSLLGHALGQVDKAFLLESLNFLSSRVGGSEHTWSRRNKAPDISAFLMSNLRFWVRLEVTDCLEVCVLNELVCACKWRYTSWKTQYPLFFLGSANRKALWI